MKIFTEEHRRNISNAKLGIPRPDWVKKKLSKAMKGRIPWNKGKRGIYSEESLKKMSESQKNNPKLIKFKKGHKCPKEWRIKAGEKNRMHRIGKKHTIETRSKIANSKLGEKNWNWKGGITPEKEKRYKSIEYKIWRELVFQRDNYTCVICHNDSGNNLNAHHILPCAEYPQFVFNPENGLTLCESCHWIWHSIKLWNSFPIINNPIMEMRK